MQKNKTYAVILQNAIIIALFFISGLTYGGDDPKDTSPKKVSTFRKYFGFGVGLSDIYTNAYTLKNNQFDNFLDIKLEFANPICNITYTRHLFNYSKYTNLEIYPTFIISLNMNRNHSSVPTTKALTAAFWLPDFRYKKFTTDRFTNTTMESNFLYLVSIRYTEEMVTDQLISIDESGEMTVGDPGKMRYRSLDFIIIDEEAWLNKIRNTAFYLNKLSKRTGVNVAKSFFTTKFLQYCPFPTLQFGYRMGLENVPDNFIFNFGLQYFGGFFIDEINMLIQPKFNVFWSYVNEMKMEKAEIGVELEFYY